MKIEFSPYPKAKRFLRNLAEQGEKESIEVLKDYEELKKDKGEFFAARYIKEIYLTFCKNWGKIEKSK